MNFSNCATVTSCLSIQNDLTVTSWTGPSNGKPSAVPILKAPPLMSTMSSPRDGALAGSAKAVCDANASRQIMETMKLLDEVIGEVIGCLEFEPDGGGRSIARRLRVAAARFTYNDTR